MGLGREAGPPCPDVGHSGMLGRAGRVELQFNLEGLLQVAGEGVGRFFNSWFAF